VIVRYCAEFKSIFPDDRIENDEGTEIIQFPGKSAATAISEMLGRLGYDADAPEHAGMDGWDFEIRVKGYPHGCRCWCTVTLIDDYYLYITNTSWWDRVREVYPAPYIEVLRALAREMAVDPRFSDVRWYLPKDAVRGLPGASKPVDD
jgi:8-oxo-dGTP pyrophosphatase MutT (NUDIX family)